MPDIDTHKRRVEDFLNQTETARVRSEKARDYVNNYQWTDEQVTRLNGRNQAAIVINRIKPKVEGLKGLMVQRKTDPKAYPRTQEHEDSAHAITDALRFVADNTDFDETKLDVADDFFVEGYGGAIVEVKLTKRGEPEIQISRIPWDRIFYDAHSRRHDFKDARYMGVVIWADIDDPMLDQFRDRLDEVVARDSAEAETFDDRPRWVDTSGKRTRVRLVKEFYLDGDTWHMAVYTGDTFLIDPAPSPILDDEGEPTNPIELVSAYVDRDNRRFGEVEYWIDLQDEINHRRSKALHLNSVRQTTGVKGAVADIPAMKRELAKPDGHVEYEGAPGAFDVLPTGDMAQAQFALLQQSTAELDAVGFNAQLAGERQGNLSGKAILALQGAGTNEIAPLFGKLNGWEKRIYRQIWGRIRQFWTQQKWVRVTDDANALRWAGFNVPMTVQELLEERVNDESLDEITRKRAAMVFASMMQAQDPRLQQVVEIRNDVAEIDVDILLEQALDTVNVQTEQFEMLANLAANRPEIPFVELLRLSALRDKQEIIDKIEEGEKNQAALLEAQAAAKAQDVQIETQGKIAQDQAATRNELQKDFVLGQQKIAAERQLLAEKAAYDERKMILDKDLATVQGSISRDVVQTVRIPDAGRLSAAMERLAETQAGDADAVSGLIDALQQPRQVVRDAEGKVEAIV